MKSPLSINKSAIFIFIVSLTFLAAFLLLFFHKEKAYWTYRDNETGLEISFPEGWSKSENNPQTDATLAQKGLRMIDVSNNRDLKWGHNTQIFIMIGKEWEKPPDSPYNERHKQQVLIDGIEAEKEIGIGKSDKKIIAIRVYLKREETYFTISFSTQTEKDWELFDNIVSTIRFK